jgi:chemotaxis signal transduction protein
VIDLELSFDEPVAAPVLASAAAAPLPHAERAQAIDCGGLGVAVPYAWARNVVEDYELTPVPNAPAWLAGATNVEGRILAVVDMANWAAPEHSGAITARSRLLVGGAGDDSFALRFVGLPALVRVDRSVQPLSPVPQALAPYITAEAAADGTARRWPVVDMAALTQVWAAELSELVS